MQEPQVMQPTSRYMQQEQWYESTAARWIIPGVVIGAAIGIAYATTQRKRTRLEKVRGITETVAENREDFVEMGRGLIDRARLIYEEGRRLVDDATSLWDHGRSVVRRA